MIKFTHMKQISSLLVLVLLGILPATAQQQIPVTTPGTALILEVDNDGHVFQRYFGPRFHNAAEYSLAPAAPQAYIGGVWKIFSNRR